MAHLRHASMVQLLPLLLLLALLPPPSAARLKKTALSCQGHCFLTAPKRQLMCTPTPPPASALPLDCTAARVRGGVRVVVGNYEPATDIHPTGLRHIESRFSGQALFLRLHLRFSALRPGPLAALQGLRNLSLVRMPKFELDPCFFVERNFSGRLRQVQIECSGSGLDLHEPFRLVWPSLAQPPEVTLRKCGVQPDCYQCQGAYRGLVLFNTARRYRLEHFQRRQLTHCHEDKKCPRDLLDSCPGVQPSTTGATTAPTTPTTSVTTSKSSTRPPAANTTRVPAVAAATANRGQRAGRGEEEAPEKESDGPNLSQLVQALSRRTERTQRFLIVILVICIINSLVLIALLIYLFRRSRLCCGRSNGKGVYVINKETQNSPFLDGNKAT